MSRRVLIALAAAALTATAALPGATAAAYPVAARQAKLERVLGELLEGGAPGAIVLFRDGSRTFRLARGVSDTARGTPMRATDRFRVGSVTKSFVAAVVLQLVGEGKLTLDDSVERWVPESFPNGASITVRHLLNHTSGIYNYTDDRRVIAPYLRGNLRYAWSPRRLVALAVEHKPLFEPGRRWSYSNTNYLVLGLIIRAVTGKPVAEELQRRIFGPLRLRSTSLDAQARIRGPHAHGYAIVRKGSARDVSVVSPSWAWTAGAIVSTVDDVATFYRALFRGRVLQPRLLQQMETTVDAGSDLHYGLGLAKTHLPCSIAWGHDGDFPGYLTFALNSRDGRRQLVVSINNDTLPPLTEETVGRLLVTGYCG